MTYDEYGRHDFTLLVEIQEVAVEAKFRFCPETLNKIFGCSGTLRLHPSPILATFSSFNFLSNLGLSRRDFGAILEGMMPKERISLYATLQRWQFSKYCDTFFSIPDYDTCAQVYITPARRCRVHLRAGVEYTCAQVL